MTLRRSDLQSDSDLDSIRNSCDVFMVLTIALVPTIARTHTNISIVTLFSLLTPAPLPPSFPCHHTGACQSSSYGLSTSNTHGRAIPRNHGFLEVAFAYMGVYGVSAANWNISGGEEHLWRNSTIAHCSLETPLTWWKNIEMKKWLSLAPKVEAARQQRTAGGVLGRGGEERQLDANCVHKDVHCVPDKSFHLQHLKKMHVWCSRDNVIDVFFGVLTGEECQLTCQFHGWARLQPMSDSSCCAFSFKKAFARSKTTRPSVNYAKDWLDSNKMYPVYLSGVYLSCQESWVYLSELIT